MLDRREGSPSGPGSKAELSKEKCYQHLGLFHLVQELYIYTLKNLCKPNVRGKNESALEY